MLGMEECQCGRKKTVVEFVKVSNTRTVIRCATCFGLIGYSDSDAMPTKEYPPLRARKYNNNMLDNLR